MIIGVTGTLAAGKGTIVKLLLEKNFKHYSVREFLIKEIEKRGLSINRDNMLLVANDLRQQNSPSYIAEELYKIANAAGGNAVIESLRTPGEIISLRNKSNFHMLSVDANPQIRYIRMLKRASETDNISFEKFINDEKREMENIDPAKPNLKKCIEMSDMKLNNDNSIEELKEKIEDILREIQIAKAIEIENNKTPIQKHIRPSWDEYFMNIAKVTGTRGSCDRGRAGTVIVKDKHILVGGYVGSPRGLPHCDEIGHLMKTVIHEDGSESRHCLRTAHSEQNAICQAAKLGIAIDGATIYTKMTPCAACAKMIINVGIKKVICAKRYHASSETEKLFEKANIKLEILDEGVQQYADQ
jgi:dCMP deaminase